MNKNIVLFSAAMISICMAAYSFMNNGHSGSCQKVVTCSPPSVLNKLFLEDMGNQAVSDFTYSVGTRFRGIKKSKINRIRSVEDFFTQDHNNQVIAYNSVRITILDDTKKNGEFVEGDNEVLSPAQIELLQSCDYSTNILVRADYIEKFNESEERTAYSTPHLTIVPEKEAEYVEGKVALHNYLKENSREAASIAQKDGLKPGKLYFTVTKDGSISDVLLTSTSGYPTIDETMIELIANTPGKWKPAENTDGDKVDQALVFSFGIIGC